ncbi:unnamed protein product [Mytilus edulis]|uniref:Mutator-like transposase domain-containing protein n=1 Tax=Mytilus edulis TaxID=6550 RepID=A0A8S3TDT6_MYTED|nr:unnamed protein product [Mytilus edulis]
MLDKGLVSQDSLRRYITDRCRELEQKPRRIICTDFRIGWIQVLQNMDFQKLFQKRKFGLPDEYLEEKSTENRTVDRDLNILMINSLIICHLNKSPKCVVPHFELVQETQWGLGWIWEMKCTKCKFISEKYKLFREINTGRAGRKSATINYGFQTGVINCNIGNDSTRLLLTSSCIPPMSKGTMQRITNNVCDKVVKLAENETEQVVENFRRKKTTLGLNKNSPVKLQMDGTYQSVHIKSRHKMGQNASQAIGIARENETDNHDIIGFHLVNELCWVCAWLCGKGYDV